MLVGYALDYNWNLCTKSPPGRRSQDHGLALEDRTARLTILIDPRKKAVLERLCAEEDATPSQVVRRLIRGYIQECTGQPWSPPDDVSKRTSRSSGGA